MSWNEKFDKADSQIKKSNSKLKDDISQKTKAKLDLTKQKIEHSNAVQFVKQKGFKNKAKFIGKGALNKFKNTNLAKNLQNIAKGVTKGAQFIVANIVPISIISGILVLGSNFTIMGVGIAQSIGETPHYYCYANPSDEIKQSKEYKQYCENETSFVKFSTVNGHYVMQDGPGPCCSCSVLNMLIRFYTNNSINIYDYLWQSNGQYAPIGNSILTTDKNQYNMRKFITSTYGKNDDSLWHAKENLPNGSMEFAKNHGKENYTMANWGYVRDPSIDSGGYTSLATNENWVWDLSLENNAEGTDWGAQWSTGNKVTIEGITATFVHESRPFRSLEELKIILNAHPAGIVVYRTYATGHNHAILVTGYNESTKKFTVIDPALGVMGGYEHDADSCVYGSGVQIFNNAILNDPAGKSYGFDNVLSFTYIEQG